MDVLSNLVGVQDGNAIRLEFIRNLVQEYYKIGNDTCLNCIKSCTACVEGVQNTKENNPRAHE